MLDEPFQGKHYDSAVLGWISPFGVTEQVGVVGELGASGTIQEAWQTQDT